jgi:hypothetical protein
MEAMERNASRWQMGFKSAFEGFNKGLDKELKTFIAFSPIILL